MDTLFRLVSLQSSSSDQHQSNSSFNSTTTSRSSNHQHHYSNNSTNAYHQQQQEQYSHNSYSYSYYPVQHQHQAYSSSYQYYYPHNSTSSPQEEEEPAEECCNKPHPTTTTPLYMDEDHFSSSSSSRHHFLTPPSSSSNPNNPNPNPNPSSSLFDPPPTDLGTRWGNDLLLDCARAVAARDTPRVQQLMWMLNELASPYGDTEQKLASYFLQALFARLTSSGPRTLRTLSSASDRTTSFDSTRRTVLRFQELSPWSSFGHVAANGAILESFLLDTTTSSASTSPPRFHILDLSNTFCTQWPTLLEALATRSADDTPHLTITTVVSSPSASSSAVQRVMKEIGARMEKFARLMGVPFKFNIVHHAGDLSTLDLDQLGLGESDTALAINCVNSLHGVSPVGQRREGFLSALRRLRPRIVTVVEEEADLDGSGREDDEEGFLKGFRESLRFFSAYFDSLEESFPKTSNERLALERAAGRAMVDLVACPSEESVERRDTAGGWSRRLRSAGMTPASFSDDVADDIRALLRRYREGWSMRTAEEEVAAGEAAAAGVFLAWKEQPVVWTSAWRL